jgi:hypothetical protein
MAHPHYLTTSTPTGVQTKRQLGNFEFDVQHIDQGYCIDRVWLMLQNEGFTASTFLKPAEARLLGEALIKAAEDAEHAAARAEAERQAELDEAWDRELEFELQRQAEEEGREYVPLAIGASHIRYLEELQWAGLPIPSWGWGLLPTLSVEHTTGTDECLVVNAETKLIYACWSRWAGSALPGHWLVLDFSAEGDTLNVDHADGWNAVVDDFGDLCNVGKPAPDDVVRSVYAASRDVPGTLEPCHA